MIGAYSWRKAAISYWRLRKPGILPSRMQGLDVSLAMIRTCAQSQEGFVYYGELKHIEMFHTLNEIVENHRSV